MESYFYKTKKITVIYPEESFGLVKDEGEIYTSLSIINNSDEDVIIIEKDEDEIDIEKGTLLGSKKILTYENTPKNSVYVYSASETSIDILVKYSE